MVIQYLPLKVVTTSHDKVPGLTQEGNSPTATDRSAIEEYSYSR